MGIWLLFLSCLGVITYDESILKINETRHIEVAAVGLPIQKAEWRDPPNVRVCATSEVSLTRTSRAVEYWRRLGYSFGTIKKDPLSMCMNPAAGEIIITLPETGFSDAHIASTRLYTHTYSGDILKAKIFILPKHARKDRVLEHEFGHALGWSHYRQRYHIMHPSWQYGGFDSYGVRKR